jgi:antitoxin PrlF
MRDFLAERVSSPGERKILPHVRQVQFSNPVSSASAKHAVAVGAIPEPGVLSPLPRLLYWSGMTHRIGAKGQVVIPKALRERAGLLPGADVEFELDGQRVSIKAADRRPELGGRFAESGMAARLLEDRSREPR